MKEVFPIQVITKVPTCNPVPFSDIGLRINKVLKTFKKNSLLLGLLCIMLSTQGYSQSIKESNVDEFTGNKVIRTSWVNVMTMKANSYIRFSQINSSTTLDLKLMIGGSVFSIKEGAELMFKMDNDKIAKFKCLEYAITSRGGGAIGLSGSGAQGLMARYTPSDSSDLNLLSNSNVSKIRIYTSDGFVDQNVSEKESNSIREALFILKDEYDHFDERHSDSKKKRK